MKTLATGIAILFLAMGCTVTSGGSPADSGQKAAVGTKTNGPVEFELRDFRLDKDTSGVGGSYKGRGTLVSRDPRLASGRYLVFLEAKQAHEGDEPYRAQVLLEDGIGTVETFAYMTSDEKDKVVKYHDWKILGYVAMLPGRIANPSEAPAPKA